MQEVHKVNEVSSTVESVKFAWQAQNYNTENIPYLRNSFVNWFRFIVKVRPEPDTPTSCDLATNIHLSHR